jgi:exodeoxyribonuclease VII large subunit
MNPPLDHDVYSVSRLNAEIRAVLEGSFPLVWVEGEISNLVTPRSGHSYFSLKDAHAQVRCALFRNRRQLLRFQPGDGDQVLVRARISLYEARGEFQLIVEHMEPAGEGALLRAFEELKARLEKEGLFDTRRKRPIPEFPHCVGVVTSPTGAAIRDILQVMARRWPGMPVIVYPTLVQGAQAPAEIADTLKLADARGECDLLILARGGGSLEDLAAFNDETLARTIAHLKTPIISAVGHEIDFTIADFVADRRAPTPSAAAELATPDRDHLLHQLETLRRHLQRGMEKLLHSRKSQLEHTRHKLRLLHPWQRLQQQQQQVDELERRLLQAIRQLIRTRSRQLQQLEGRLRLHSPRQQLELMQQRLASDRQRLIQVMQGRLSTSASRLSTLSRALHAVSPLQTLARGYSITTDA